MGLGGARGNERGNRQNRLHLESRTPFWAGLWTLYLWKRHTERKTMPPGRKSPRARTKTL